MRPTLQCLLALAPLVLPSLAPGQFTTPPGFLSTEGMHWQNLTNTNGYSFLFGSYRSGRYQQIDGEIKAKGARTLTSVGFRLDHRLHQGTAVGRSWSNVRLTLSAGDHTKVSKTFSLNQLSTPTAVFSGTVTWPLVASTPTTKPAPWSSHYAFPFGTGGTSSKYLYDAKSDLCLDYTFTGGRLVNRIPWSGWRAYFLDGVHVRTAMRFGVEHFGRIGTGNGTCSDSSSARRPSGWVQTALWGPAFNGNPAWRGKAIAELFSFNTAPNSFVVHAVGLSGSTTGTPIGGFGCYNLMLDMTQVQLISRLPTDVTGSSTWRYVPLGDLTKLAPLGKSVSFWAQAAWNDSKTGQVKLTGATRCTPDFSLKLNSTVPKKRVVFEDPDSNYGPQVTVENAITRYR